MARTAVPGRLSTQLAWRVGRLVEGRAESPTARTLVLDVPGWPGHLPGQHVDVRLTAEDGYTAQRSYSIANAADGERVELTVQRIPDGEVSEYLVDVYSVGDPVEIRGPVGGWFVWRPTDTDPVLLVAGGSGIVPLMAMVRTRRAARAERLGAHARRRLLRRRTAPAGTRRPRAGCELRVHPRRAAGLAEPAAADRHGGARHGRLAAGLHARVLRVRPDRIRGVRLRRPGRPRSRPAARPHGTFRPEQPERWRVTRAPRAWPPVTGPSK